MLFALCYNISTEIFMTIMITGVAGFIGFHLANQLLKRGENIDLNLLNIIGNQETEIQLDIRFN